MEGEKRAIIRNRALRCQTGVVFAGLNRMQVGRQPDIALVGLTADLHAWQQTQVGKPGAERAENALAVEEVILRLHGQRRAEDDGRERQE